MGFPLRFPLWKRGLGGFSNHCVPLNTPSACGGDLLFWSFSCVSDFDIRVSALCQHQKERKLIERAIIMKTAQSTHFHRYACQLLLMLIIFLMSSPVHAQIYSLSPDQPWAMQTPGSLSYQKALSLKRTILRRSIR